MTKGRHYFSRTDWTLARARPTLFPHGRPADRSMQHNMHCGGFLPNDDEYSCFCIPSTAATALSRPIENNTLPSGAICPEVGNSSAGGAHSPTSGAPSGALAPVDASMEVEVVEHGPDPITPTAGDGTTTLMTMTDEKRDCPRCRGDHFRRAVTHAIRSEIQFNSPVHALPGRGARLQLRASRRLRRCCLQIRLPCRMPCRCRTRSPSACQIRRRRPCSQFLSARCEIRARRGRMEACPTASRALV